MSTLTNAQSGFETDVDLWSDEVLADPYPTFQRLRDIGPAAYLTRYDMWLTTRYDIVKGALTDWESFSSAHLGGIALNPGTNIAWQGSALNTDPPEHSVPRTVFDNALRPRHLRNSLPDIDARAHRLVDILLEKGEFDGVQDFARDLPLHIVMDLVGWPQEGRREMLEWAEGAFNAAGPEGNPRTVEGVNRVVAAMRFLSETVNADNIAPGSFGSIIFQAAESGALPREFVPITLAGYLNASLDTTINAVASTLWLFATHPEQWQLVHSDPTLVPSAFSEGVRMESPIQFFSRATTRAVDLGDGCVIPADSRVVHSYGAANRDERHYADPHVFDVRRNPTDHLAFDFGVHACPGRTLTTMEGHALFTALAEKVSTIELTADPTWTPNNMTRGPSSVPVRIRAA